MWDASISEFLRELLTWLKMTPFSLLYVSPSCLKNIRFIITCSHWLFPLLNLLTTWYTILWQNHLMWANFNCLIAKKEHLISEPDRQLWKIWEWCLNVPYFDSYHKSVTYETLNSLLWYRLFLFNRRYKHPIQTYSFWDVILLRTSSLITSWYIGKLPSYRRSGHFEKNLTRLISILTMFEY